MLQMPAGIRFSSCALRILPRRTLGGVQLQAESAALLVDDVFPCQPVRQWVLSFPYPLRFLFASRPGVMGRVLGIAYRAIATHLIKKAGFRKKAAHTGAVTLIQCFGGSLNLNVLCEASHKIFMWSRSGSAPI
jgi:hypothetical protein